MTTTEAAHVLGVSRARVIALCQAGLLIAEQPGREWIIDPASVEARKKTPHPQGWKPGRKRNNLK